MIQTSLPFQYEIENKPENTTALGGLPLYLELMQVIGLRDIIIKRMQEHKTAQGWTDDQFIIDLILLNLAGGDCVEDLKKLEEDKGFCKVLRHVDSTSRDLRIHLSECYAASSILIIRSTAASAL